jgi:hypothetical protein
VLRNFNLKLEAIMKKIILLSIFLVISRILIYANPIDGTPITKFSELVFDNNNWKMELLFPFGYSTDIDSIVLKVSNVESKLNVTYSYGTMLGLITSDSLVAPLIINRNGDKIDIYTYSSSYGSQVRVDQVEFGDYPEATVGAPINGYSIIRNTWEYLSNNITIDCLTKSPSLGAPNDTTGLCGILKGKIYDSDNNLVTKLKVFPVAPCYFILETPISIDSNGNYTTNIFPTIYNPGYIIVRLAYFGGWIDTEYINTFDLKDIHPDTVVIQDIYLQSNRYVVTSVKDIKLPDSDKLQLLNYPNPFNSTTNFVVKIPNMLRGKSSIISIYNVNGELIRTIPIINSDNILQWDSKDSKGVTMSSGIYYYRLNIDNRVVGSGSMILLK